MSATKSVCEPAPTGPTVTATSPPMLNDPDSTVLGAFSVIRKLTISDIETPTWTPTLAVPTL